MDQPSWNDTLRATLGACVPCFTCGRPQSNAAASDSDDEYANSNGVRGVRRARADELEGLLADAHSSSSGNSGDDGWRDRDDDAAADADAISLHSHLGPRGRKRAPPRTPKHISLWGFNVFGRARGVALEGGDDALHAHPHPPASGTAAGDAATAGKRTKRRGAQHSTDDLLARAALDAGPTQLKDVSAADVARRARSGSTASHPETPVETDHERRARRKARKEMRRLAAALAEAPGTPTEFEGFPGSGDLPPTPHKGIPAPFLHLSSPAPDALAQLQAADDEDAADLDGLAYARLAPRPMGGSQSQSRSSGRSSGSGSGAPPYSPVGEVGYVGTPRPKKSKSKRSTKSKSSATSSTLASPPPTSPSFPHGVRDSPLRDSGVEFGAFTSGGAEDEFDGTPGGFDSSFGVEAEPEPEVVREALPSPGLSRGAGGFRFGGGNGGGKGMGGF